MYLRQNWRDQRLTYRATPDNEKSVEIRLGEGTWERIWVPDTFLRNEKRANFHEVTVSNRLLRLNSTGYLWYVITGYTCGTTSLPGTCGTSSSTYLLLLPLTTTLVQRLEVKGQRKDRTRNARQPLNRRSLNYGCHVRR